MRGWLTGSHLGGFVNRAQYARNASSLSSLTHVLPSIAWGLKKNYKFHRSNFLVEWDMQEIARELYHICTHNITWGWTNLTAVDQKKCLKPTIVCTKYKCTSERHVYHSNDLLTSCQVCFPLTMHLTLRLLMSYIHIYIIYIWSTYSWCF